MFSTGVVYRAFTRLVLFSFLLLLSVILGRSTAETVLAQAEPADPSDVVRTRATVTYLDTFEAVSYNNSDGSADWSDTEWFETEGQIPMVRQNPAAGFITIENGHLIIRGETSERLGFDRRIDLTGATAATLSFDYEQDVWRQLEPGEELLVEVTGNSGRSFTTVYTIDHTSATSNDTTPGLEASSGNIDITPYATANFEVRLRQNVPWDDAVDRVHIDNFQVVATIAEEVIAGIIYRDPNANGIHDNIAEYGVSNITVNAYDNSGAVIATDVSDENGMYILDVPVGTQVRVEVESIPSFLGDSVLGDNSHSRASFVTSPAYEHDIALINPYSFCADSAQLATSCYLGGNQSAGMPLLVSVQEDDVSLDLPVDVPTGIYNVEGLDSDTGTVWGVAYHRKSNLLFAGSYIKRFSGLHPLSETNPAVYNPTTIYMVERDTGTVSPWITLDPTRPVPHSGPTDSPPWSADFDTFAYAHKEGLGDVDISQDQSTLYAVDLGARELVSIPINPDNSAGTPTRIDLLANLDSSVPQGISDCRDGSGAIAPNDVRPFGLGVHPDTGDLYIGVVCSGQSTVDESDFPISPNANISERPGDPSVLRAYVYRWDGGTSFTRVIHREDMTVERACTNDMEIVNCDEISRISASWAPWTDTYPYHDTPGQTTHRASYPQPSLVDIEFDRGDMILGYADRWGAQVSWKSMTPAYPQNNNGSGGFGFLLVGEPAGQIRRACWNGSEWVDESVPGGCKNTIGVVTYGNSTQFIDEYYYNDRIYFGRHGGHSSTALGGIAQIPGRIDVISASYDADLTTVDSGGLLWLDNNYGDFDGAYLLYELGDIGKGEGIGDIAPICGLPPVEIGNRVWCDIDSGNSAADQNGVQDPGEAGIANLTLVLDCGGDGSSTVTTDSDGTYKFTDLQWAADNGSGTRIPRNSTCTVRIDTNASSAALDVCGLDVTATAQGADLDLRDSDGAVSGATVSAEVNIGDDGFVTHDIDFGFAPASGYDFGDLPDDSINQDFNTVEAENGPRHLISSNIYLGSCVDSETNGVPDQEAGLDAVGGDDNAVGSSTYGVCATPGDDEDGIELLTPLIPAKVACIAVTANVSGVAKLNGWIDWNGDGVFTLSDKMSFMRVNNVSITPTQNPSVTGQVNAMPYCFYVPNRTLATYDGGETHMRIRLSTAGNLNSTGVASDGEVEDYHIPLACVGNFVWNDTNGISPNTQDSGDIPIDGASVRLVWAGPNDVIETMAANATAQGDDEIYTTTTDAGAYRFCGLINDAPNTYRIDVLPPIDVPMAVSTGAGDMYIDNDGTQAGSAQRMSSAPFTISSDPLPLSESGTTDFPGGWNNFPDGRDNQSIDFGLFVEPTAVRVSTVSAETVPMPLLVILLLATMTTGLFVHQRRQRHLR